MDLLRTPDERFVNLPGYAFSPHYAELGELRIAKGGHFIQEDAGPELATIVAAFVASTR